MEGRAAAVLGVLLLAIVAPTGAHAADQRVNGFVGGAPGTAAGHFLEPRDVAVLHRDFGESKILVVEGLARNSRVQRLDDDGNFELSWGRDVVRAGADGETGTGYEVCSQAAACKAGVPGEQPGELATPSGIAVNQASGGVYVLDAGNSRVQQFTLDGDFVRAWPLAVAGGRGGFEHAPIAVAPGEPHDVFVGDEAANRVLQFDAEGEFLRAWGWGVDSGGDEFEACADEDDCRAGKRPPGIDARKATWPRHLAVDADEVVYGSTFLGIEFDSHALRTKIFRFRSEDPPDPLDRPSASDALLDPLVTDGATVSESGTRYLTNGATLGLDVDPADGSLLAINNPFGTSRMDVVENLTTGDERPLVQVVDKLPFLQNVSGIAAADGFVLLSSGAVEQLTGTSSFTGCARDVERDCHGLIAVATRAPAQAAMTAIPGVGTDAALIDAGGVATYQFEISRDGRRWRPLGDRRYVAGSRPEPVPAEPSSFPAGTPYKLRVVTTKKTEQGIASTVSPEGLFVAG